MRTSTDRPSRTAAAALTAVAALTAGLLTAGCDDRAPGAAAERPAAKPRASAGPVWNTRPDSLASLGDSITRGFDACRLLKDCPEVSWATGTEVDSLAARLLPSPQTRSWNFARTGARMADLPRQVAAAVPHRPQLVTVLLGANDACRADVAEMTSVKDFRADFEKSLKELRRSLPKTQVYVASVPDLKRLWSEGSKSPLGKQVWKLGICPSMLRDSELVDAPTRERREKVDRRVKEYNAVLEDVCRRDLLCRYDGGSVHSYGFTGADLSHWDWFHPNKEGQRQLAELAYRRITTAGR
ncbi:SGNH/GDSL hydrolase family protein [Streptomyces mobaraensis NBRC 13819 = DSM 40847]|uniref:SGNH/GDSL hydrolase family protein n=2 Tax=Streptomyces mobaraensis TaxID=35621 RepID=A0A5N5WD86_STRMB|nr:SGNH/GDSL hydrolase family protein [Streptomyces mobaraensis]EME99296.1 G-D-S-L family lipolytic protein [Streptomyces mobaraensis NBRC 13819 = DSM 40847]KAB7850296.1 SGNH/GDSL hydrolase family protein [Streptomyces mobaraensis]QTT73689.1 SGNH/GDSL hydrolase family protein [Streptomyces mobaraensis NBRC 13819 = DSM 40847]